MGVAILVASCAAASTQPSLGSVKEVTGNPSAQARLARTYGQLPLLFEPNRGQVEKEVKWLARCRGYTLFLTEREAVMALRQGKDKPSSVVRMRLAGSQPWRASEGLEPTGGISNYFLGNDPKKWRTNIPHYRQVKLAGVYAGIDLVFYGNPRRLEYDLVAQPGADPKQIRLAYEGVKQIWVDAAGDLVLTTHTGVELRQQRPRVYQDIGGQKVEVAGVYEILERRQVRIQVAFYDTSRPLVIDPVLVYSTYLGGSGDEIGHGIAADGAGSAYVTGSTTSANLPAMNPIQEDFGAGLYDVFVAKFDSSGSALVYSTYLGGNGPDEGHGIAVDASGNAYVAGETSSTDFPTARPFQPNLRVDARCSHSINSASFPCSDAFVTKLNAGGALVYSTYLGGWDSDDARGIAVDAQGNAHLAGCTGRGSDFPTVNPLPSTQWGDIFVAKVNASGSALLYSTYLGGLPRANSIALDPAGNAYVTGETPFYSSFPTVGALFPTFGGGGNDAFVAKLSATGSSLIYSTYLGGAGWEEGLGIAVDSSGNVYVTGRTDSENFPTANAFQPVKGGPAPQFQRGSDAFVAKLNAEGSVLIYSTYFGGTGDEEGNAIAVDGAGNAYITGPTISTDLPTASPLQAANARGYDAFVAKLDPEGSALVYSTYLGSSDGSDWAKGIALDGSGGVYILGTTNSASFPGIGDVPFSAGGGYDAFVSKLEDQASQPGVVTTVSAASFAAGVPVAPESIASGFGQGLAATTEVATTLPLPTTLADVTVNVRDSAGVERAAPLFFVSAEQINYLIPSETMSGTATVTVTRGAQVVASGKLEIEAVAPGLFTANSDGRGVAAAVTLRMAADNSQSYENVFQCGATPGSCVAKPIDLGPETDQMFLILYGTGIRGRSSLSAVSVKVGGAESPVEYAGPAPGFVGLDQVNVRLPRSLSGRGETEVVLTVAVKTANTVKVTIW